MSFLFSPIRVAELLEQVATLLHHQPDEFDRFKCWAEQTIRQVLAAQARDALGAHAEGLCRELAALKGPTTARLTELQRVCRREWLRHLISWLEEEREERAAA